MKILWRWINDYYYGATTLFHTLFFWYIPKKYRAENLKNSPVIIIPGLLNRWNIFRKIIKPLILQGHPVYEVKGLGRNTIQIAEGAKLVRRVIDENSLENVILVGHSKGGLLGKHALAFSNHDGKIKKLISVAPPFAGTTLAKKFPRLIHREILPGSDTLNELALCTEVNNKIVCIYALWDNVVMPLESCVLDGAKNIQMNVYGHQKIIFHKDTEDLIINQLKS